MQYFVTNTVRRTSTRTARAMAPTRARFTQRICGNSVRLVRGKLRGVTISEDQLNQYWDELQDKQNKGLISVHEGSPTGLVVDFDKHPPIKKEDVPKELLETPVETPTESAPVAEAKTEDKSPDKMNKSELIDYASQVLGEDPSALETLTKRQIMERLK